MPKSAYLSLSLMLFITSLSLNALPMQRINASSILNDGPYVVENPESWSIHWVCHGLAKIRQVAKTAMFPYEFRQCGLNATWSPIIDDPQTNFVTDYPIAAISDIHGQFELMKRLLKQHEIIDSLGNWSFSQGHLVITGDIFDRGDKVTETLWFAYELERQARQQGGRVHFLLGNHEVMVLQGDLRYLHTKYQQVESVLQSSMQQLYSENAILGRWLRTKNAVLKINQSLFMHGGLHPNILERDLSLADINQQLRHSLNSQTEASNHDLSQYLLGVEGPLWHRGYFDTDTTAEIDNLLTRYQAQRLVVGHTSQPQVQSRHNGKVIAVDSSIKMGKSAEMLLINKQQLLRATLDGKQLPLP